MLTYRDDELGTGHPLRQLLGLASRVQPVRRLRLARLSVSAVRRLSAAAALDAPNWASSTRAGEFRAAGTAVPRSRSGPVPWPGDDVTRPGVEPLFHEHH